MAQVPDSTKRALVACSLWLHIGFIGASAVAIGVLHLVDGDAPLSALALAVSGGILAAAGWRRSRTVLDAAEQPSRIGRDARTASPAS
jgi:uncharacterized membrane protein